MKSRPTPPAARTNIWVGVGGKLGTMFAVSGIDTMGGVVFSVDEFGKAIVIAAKKATRLGAGWGAGGGAFVIVALGVTQPSQLNGMMTGGWDFNISVGANWGKWIGGASKSMRWIEPVTEWIAKYGAKTPDRLKVILKDPDKYSEFVKLVKTAALDMPDSTSSAPQLFTLDVWGGRG